MAKRFTDTAKWQDEWFMDLPAKYKLFYLFILDNCDHAGIWKVNFRLASFNIGDKIDPQEAAEILEGRVLEFKEGYWFILKFIDFQYGGVKKDKVGQSISKILETNNLHGAIKGLPRGYEAPKVKYKVKDKDKVIEGGMGGDFNWQSVKQYFFNAEAWMYKFCSSKSISRDILVGYMTEFINDIELRNEYKPLKDLQSHFTNWFNKSSKIKTKQNDKFDKYRKNERGAQQLLELLRSERETDTN